MSIGLQTPEVALLNAAKGLTWVRETQGPNRGEVVDEIVRQTGLDPAGAYAWCACFCAFVGRLVIGRDKWPLKPWAGCDQLHDEAKAKGMVENYPTNGAIFLLWRPKDKFFHAGFVVAAVKDSTTGEWLTVEGNSNEAGEPEGVGVFARTRKFPETSRFIHWWK